MHANPVFEGNSRAAVNLDVAATLHRHKALSPQDRADSRNQQLHTVACTVSVTLLSRPHVFVHEHDRNMKSRY